MSKRKIYRKLVSVDEVIPIVERYHPLKPLGELEIPLNEALGRVLSRNVYARVNYPPYTRSLMDGYAVISDDLIGVYEDRPKRLRLIGYVSTGDTEILRIGRGECIELSTGAVIPYPADAVVPVEYTHREGDYIVFYRSVARGENIDHIGSDFSEGEVAAWKGEVVTPTLASMLAALGVDRVYVYKPVKVGILPTGREIRNLGEPLDYGCIYDSNSYLIYSYAKLIGADPRIYGRALDDESDVEDKLRRAMEENDIVVTIGGTSAGLEDVVYRVLSKLNPGLIIHGVREKPGRPLAIAIHRDKIVLGLPGFPLSCLLTVNLYLLPILAKLQGFRSYEYRYIDACITIPLRGEPGIRVFIPAVLVERGGVVKAYPLPGHSGRISSLSLVDGYIIVPENLEYTPQNYSLKVLVNPFWKPYDINIIGSHDPLLQHIVGYISSTENIRMLNVGSMTGLHMIKMGIADIAGTHLLDYETREYNIPFVRKLGLNNIILIRGYLREQGFVYRSGIGCITSIGDIIDKSLNFVNRNPGSGTRILVDLLLEEEARRRGLEIDELKNMVRGYNFEVKTHEAVAYIVSKGIADVGVAIRYVAERYNLAFTHINYERYDLVVRKDSLGKNIARQLVEQIDRLASRFIEYFPGYKIDDKIGEKIEF
ncbi:molybdopterin biosynthesis protein [Candidatus Bathyarchaeota archaeon]|nr:molybdopterin biosynthesis protein [Candidatus Bathyarchaeota archaeon]